MVADHVGPEFTGKLIPLSELWIPRELFMDRGLTDSQWAVSYAPNKRGECMAHRNVFEQLAFQCLGEFPDAAGGSMNSD